MSAAVPDVSLEQIPAQEPVTDPLHSSSSLLLPVKQEPCYDSNIMPDSGMHSLGSNVKFCVL